MALGPSLGCQVDFSGRTCVTHDGRTQLSSWLHGAEELIEVDLLGIRFPGLVVSTVGVIMNASTCPQQSGQESVRQLMIRLVIWNTSKKLKNTLESWTIAIGRTL